MRKSRFGAFLIAAAILMAGAPSFAQPAPEAGTTVNYADLSQTQRIGVIRALVENGQIAEAQALLDVSVFDEGDLGYQAAFLQSVIWRITGQLEDAAALLRQILAERPDFRLVRLELAQVLAMLGQTEGAQFHLNILAEAAEDAGEREFFEAAIDRITPEDRLSFSTFLTIAPSTNLNSGGGRTTILFNGIPLTGGVQQESGVGVSYGGTAIYTIPLAEERQLYFAGAAQVNEYPGTEFDNQILTGRIGMHFGPLTRRATVELLTDQRWLDGNSFDSSMGLRLAGRLSLGDGYRIEGEYVYSDRDFRTNPDQVNQTAEVTVRKALSAASGLSFGVIAESSDTLLDANEYDGLGIEIGAYRGFSNGLVLDAAVEFKRRDYRGPSALAFGAARRDDITRVRLSGLSSRIQFRGVTPRVSLTWTDNASNSPLSDFEAFGAEFTLTSSF